MSNQPAIGVKAIIIQDGQLLTVYKNTAANDDPMYTIPGGKLEFGEQLDEGVRRECREEIGAEVTVGPLMFVRDFIEERLFPQLSTPVHVVDMMFQCQLPADYSPRLGHNPDEEQLAVVWLPIARLHEYPFFPQILQRLLLDSEPNGLYLGLVN